MNELISNLFAAHFVVSGIMLIGFFFYFLGDDEAKEKLYNFIFYLMWGVLPFGIFFFLEYNKYVIFVDTSFIFLLLAFIPSIIYYGLGFKFAINYYEKNIEGNQYDDIEKPKKNTIKRKEIPQNNDKKSFFDHLDEIITFKPKIGFFEININKLLRKIFGK
jgi:hypothetical protein